MRTTLSIDDDVIKKARSIAAKSRKPFRMIINEALRAGLKEVGRDAKQRKYRTEPHAMGLRAGRNIDNIQDLLGHVEGEDSR
ncbi:MAG: DUF2191 domain-containing protein [Thermodesulfobacteriota bacterium]